MELDNDEIICPECNGRGILDNYIFKLGRKYNEVCYKCQGDGTLDWIENVIGKKYVPKTVITSGVIPIFQTSYYRKLRRIEE